MDKVRIGVVGVGNRGMGFAKLAHQHPLAELAAISEPNRERGRRAARRLEADVPVFENIEDLLDSNLTDALVISAPDYAHKELALKASEAGQHLLVEKPIATSVADGLAILEACRARDRVLYMGFNLRHSPVVREMKRLVSERGEVGTPFHMLALEYYNGGRTYMGRWNRLKKYSGGLFIHKGTHDFDVINWINFPARPVWVSASAAVNALDPDHLPFEVKEGETVGPTCHQCDCAYKCPDKSHRAPQPGQDNSLALFDEQTAAQDEYYADLCIFLSDKDTHDNAMAMVEYDNGARGFHNEVFVTSVSKRDYVVIGDRGHLEASTREHAINIWPRWSENRVTHDVRGVAGGHGGSDPSLMGSFVLSVLKGERPLAGAVDGVWALAVGQACETAREENRVVHLKELLDPGSDLLKAERT